MCDARVYESCPACLDNPDDSEICFMCEGEGYIEELVNMEILSVFD